jgi:hypothetical protein
MQISVIKMSIEILLHVRGQNYCPFLSRIASGQVPGVAKPFCPGNLLLSQEWPCTTQDRCSHTDYYLQHDFTLESQNLKFLHLTSTVWKSNIQYGIQTYIISVISLTLYIFGANLIPVGEECHTHV